VFDACAEWYEIGLQLKLSPGTLESIVTDESKNSRAAYRKMLQKWLETGTNKTWRALADALGSKTVGKGDLKQKIMEKHCSKS